MSCFSIKKVYLWKTTKVGYRFVNFFDGEESPDSIE